MMAQATRLSKIKATELEKRYNEEVRLRKEAEKAVARLQLQAQAMEQKHDKEMRRLLAIERERAEKVKLQLKTLEQKHENMRSKAEGVESKYNRELVLNRALTRENQKLERFKGQVESHNRALSLEKALITREKQNLESCKRDTYAMREERDNALKLVDEIRTKQKRDTDALRKERDNALRLVEEMRTKQKRETDAMQKERDNALRSVEEMRTKQKRETDAMLEERDNALRLVEEITTKQMEQGQQPPGSFICPITQEVMQDPQVTADGHTYEANAIRTWFATGHHTSPLTNLKLSHRNLVPNIALRSAIQEF